MFYIKKLDDLKKLYKYVINKSRPKTDYWGTPDKIYF